MAAKKGGLGKGLDSLIADKKPAAARAVKKPQKEEAVKKEVQTLKIKDVEPNRDQPRQYFDEAALEELTESVKKFGVLQPLLVQKNKDYYEIIAGERRWRAAKAAGLKEVPVIIKELTSQERMEIALIENIQREDLNPIEEAKAYKQLLEEFSLKQEEVAERVSKSRSAITNSMRLLKLDEGVQQLLVDQQISAGHARALLSIDDKESQIALAKEIVDKGLSVREVEKRCKAPKKAAKADKPKVSEQEALAYKTVEGRLKEVLGTKVEIKNKAGKGKIEISYYSLEELDRLLTLLERQA